MPEELFLGRLKVVIIANAHLQSQARTHAILFSSDL
jgi:hypothetical protein